jgi:hypothetical protein
MVQRLEQAWGSQVKIVASPMTLIEAFNSGDSRSEKRWDWTLSRVGVPSIDKDHARQAQRILGEAGLHGQKYAIDAVVAIVARQQTGQVTVLTSDTDDLGRLLPKHIAIQKV